MSTPVLNNYEVGGFAVPTFNPASMADPGQIAGAAAETERLASAQTMQISQQAAGQADAAAKQAAGEEYAAQRELAAQQEGWADTFALDIVAAGAAALSMNMAVPGAGLIMGASAISTAGQFMRDRRSSSGGEEGNGEREQAIDADDWVRGSQARKAAETQNQPAPAARATDGEYARNVATQGVGRIDLSNLSQTPLGLGAMNTENAKGVSHFKSSVEGPSSSVDTSDLEFRVANARASIGCIRGASVSTGLNNEDVLGHLERLRNNLGIDDPEPEVQYNSAPSMAA